MERDDVVDGMNKEQVIVTWGEPNSRSSIEREEADTRWIYGTLTNRDYIYFDNDVVVKVQ